MGNTKYEKWQFGNNSERSTCKGIPNIKDLLMKCQLCAGKYCLRFFVEQISRTLRTKAILSPTDRSKEVYKGFVIWPFLN